MQNHWLGIHSDKILVDSSTKNTLKLYLKILFGRSAQSAKIFGIFEEKILLGVRSPCQLPFDLGRSPCQRRSR